MFTPKSIESRNEALFQLDAYKNKFDNNLEANAEHELDKYYTFDEKGHIMVVTTSKDTEHVDPKVTETFQKCIVFFGAWTAAITKKGKTLFDYDAVKSVIANSGWFVNTEMEKRSFHSNSTSATLDTTIIQDVLGGGVTGGGVAIAKRVLASLGNTIKASFEKKDTKKEICHLLFICESLMGMPIVTVSIYHTSMEQHSWVSTTNCSSVSHQTIDFKYDADDFLFVDPTLIGKCTKEFENSPEYDKLIDKLASYVK